MGLFDFLKKNIPIENPLKWDIHNHLAFGIDDGAPDLETAITMAEYYVSLGYTKVTATPHIMGDFYKNNKQSISFPIEILKESLSKKNIPLQIEFAAEYYVDEALFSKIKEKEELLTFMGNKVLIETAFMSAPRQFEQLLFDMFAQGYMPVFAHPERYIYLQNNYSLVETLLQSGLQFQINLLSLSGYYSKESKKLAEWLINKGYYSFLGTDAHSLKHLVALNEVYKSKTFNKINWQQVQNYTV
jgi:protein-tyrosine phosphatase